MEALAHWKQVFSSLEEQDQRPGKNPEGNLTNAAPSQDQGARCVQPRAAELINA